MHNRKKKFIQRKNSAYYWRMPPIEELEGEKSIVTNFSHLLPALCYRFWEQSKTIFYKCYYNNNNKTYRQNKNRRTHTGMKKNSLYSIIRY